MIWQLGGAGFKSTGPQHNKVRAHTAGQGIVASIDVTARSNGL